jgi:outer membrane protein assembly factor BamD
VRKNNILNIIAVILLVFVIASCSQYKKVLKSSDYELKYKMANEYYKSKDYVRAFVLFEELGLVFRGTNRAEEVAYKLAYCTYGMEDYIMATYELKNFVKQYPKSEYAEEAMFTNAYCYYLDSPRYSLDQANTSIALTELQLFVTMFPNSARIAQCNDLIDKLRIKLQNKLYDLAKLYYDMEEYKSAIITFNNFCKEFPESKNCEESKFLSIKSQYLLAKKSIESKKMERFRSVEKMYIEFIDYYPNSKYLKTLEDYYKSSTEYIQKNNIKS